MIVDALAMCRQEEHRLAGDVICGSHTVAHYALLKLREIAQRRKFVTQSPIRVALVALHNPNTAVQHQAAMLLAVVGSRRTMTALRWKLAECPHEMVASVLKEALAKAARRKPATSRILEKVI